MNYAYSILISILLFLTGSVASAQDLSGQSYYEVDATSVMINIGRSDYEVAVALFRYGKWQSEVSAIEAYLGLGITEDNWQSASGCDLETVKVPRLYGVAYKAYLPSSSSLKFFGRLGYGGVVGERITSGACPGYYWSDDDVRDDGGLTYGFGGTKLLSGNSQIDFGYTVYFDGNFDGIADTTINALHVGYNKTF